MTSSTSLSICRSCLSRRPSTALIRPSHTRLLLLPSMTSIRSRPPPSSSSSPFSTTPSPSAAAKQPTSKPKPGGAGKPAAKKKKPKTHFKIWSQAATEKFALMDAVRYIRAFEVGRDQRQMKYELAVKLYTMKNGPTVKNRIRLPKAVKTDLRICVFAEGKAAAAATEAGASVVGVEELWDEIKAGKINFDRVICHKDVLPRLQKANLGRVLGPKGLMPSPKTGTVVANVTEAIQAMVGASEYRERAGVVRIAIGQLGFSAQELANNVKAFISALKSDLGRIEDFDKRINEIVLSSTNGPGFSLSGLFRSSVVEGQEEIEVEQDEVLEAVEEGEEAVEETVSVEEQLAAA